ncbi:hypothetical protein CMO90_02945 [Candidatus Woesearchaeota archaeon]|nr:hypothetical protein [Candidatus Woesearchaeota archaeon]
MSEYSKGLLEAEFWSKAGKEVLEPKSKKERKNFIKNLSNKKAELYVDEEEAEIFKLQPKFEGKFGSYQRTGYPSPAKRHKLVFESANASVEEIYFWILNYIRTDVSYPKLHKITDIFSASEQSALWGGAQSRMKIQQDTVSQYFAAIGKMVKDLFQIVRELRIIDERLEIYDKWTELKSADITLKGLYIDLVEGASKNPSSVYGLAQQVGFTILPDLFFNTHIYELKDVDTIVDAMKYNNSVKNVLKRKIMSYINWKLKTDKEIRSRRKFQLKYLRQHWSVIKMYMDWMKPYLRNIRRMQMSEKHIESVDIVSAFETSMTEIEFMAVKATHKNVHPVIIATFVFRTKPELSFQKDQYAHKGPVHVGRVEMELRTYGWSDQEIENYRKYRRDEGINMFGVVDNSVKSAMDALGEELENYLEEAGEPIEKEPKETKKIKKRMNFGMLDPFISIFKGFGELFGALIPISLPEKKSKKISKPSSEEKKSASSTATNNAWLVYKHYKKAHKMITW